LRHEIHFPALRFKPLDPVSQHLLTAPQRNTFLKLAIRHVPQAILEAVHAHEPFRATVIWGNFLVRYRPRPKIARPKT